MNLKSTLKLGKLWILSELVSKSRFVSDYLMIALYFFPCLKKLELELCLDHMLVFYLGSNLSGCSCYSSLGECRVCGGG